MFKSGAGDAQPRRAISGVKAAFLVAMDTGAGRGGTSLRQHQSSRFGIRWTARLAAIALIALPVVSVMASPASAHGGDDNGGSSCPRGTGAVTNVSFVINGTTTVAHLGGNVRSGESVTANFTVAKACKNVQVSLASYSAPAATYDRNTADQQVLFDSATGSFSAGPQSLKVSVTPGCFQVDFVLGAVITQLGPASSHNFYGDQGRLIDHDNGCTTPPPKPATPLTPRVWLGYADDYRSIPLPPTFTPTPWAGDANVIFVGCQNTVPVTPGSTCPSEDTGAIRIDNLNTGPGGSTTGGADISVSNVTVTVGTCTFNPWPGLNQTVPAGKSLVLAQTGGFAGPADCIMALGPFDHLYTNFDTSERPGQLPGFKCYSNNGLIPQISMKVANSTTATSIDTSLAPGPIADSGQILNTGGTDVGACNGINETTNWSKILG